MRKVPFVINLRYSEMGHKILTYKLHLASNLLRCSKKKHFWEGWCFDSSIPSCSKCIALFWIFPLASWANSKHEPILKHLKGIKTSSLSQKFLYADLNRSQFSGTYLEEQFSHEVFFNSRTVVLTWTLNGALIMFLSVLKETLEDQGPGPFLVLALTWNWYSVLSSKSVKIAFRSVVVRVNLSSETRLFHKCMSYIVICKIKE